MNLSLEQYNAAKGPFPRRTLISAAAGCGKTSVAVQTYAELLRTGTDPSTIVAVTFTLAAAGELKSRLSHLPPPLHIGTFHSLAGVFGLELKVADQGLCEQFKAEALKAFPKEKWPTPLDIAKSVGGQEYNGQVSGNRPYRAYLHSLHSHGMVDFDGVLARLACVAENSEAAPPAGPYLGCDMELQNLTFLVDEYQDSGPAERLLYSKVGRLIACSDFRQLLYDWRGADPSARNGFDEYRQLGHSYRCPSIICDWVNSFIGDETDGPLVGDHDGYLSLVPISNAFGQQSEPVDVLLCRSNRDVDHMKLLAMTLDIKVAQVEDPWRTNPIHLKFLAWLSSMANPNDATIARWLKACGGDWLECALDKASKQMTDLASVVDIGTFHGPPSLETEYPDLAKAMADANQIVDDRKRESSDTTHSRLQSLLIGLEQESRLKQVGEGVQIRTIHSSKGLEFGRVALYMPRWTDTPENRRLLYVAATRARTGFSLVDVGQDFPPFL